MPKKRYTIGYLTTEYKDVVVAENAQVEIVWIWATNRSGGSVSMEIAHVPAGASADETMDLMHDYAMAANALFTQECVIYMNPGDRIVAKASGSDAIVLNIYGVEAYAARDTQPRDLRARGNLLNGEVRAGFGTDQFFRPGSYA